MNTTPSQNMSLAWLRLKPRCRVFLEKLKVLQLVKQFIEPEESLPWQIQSAPSHPISLRSTLILYSHLWPVLPSGYSFQASVQKSHIYFSSPILATCPTYPILYYPITWITCGEEYKSRLSSLREFLRPSYVFLPLDFKYTLQPFLNTLLYQCKDCSVSKINSDYMYTLKTYIQYLLLPQLAVYTGVLYNSQISLTTHQRKSLLTISQGRKNTHTFYSPSPVISPVN